jgi:hypothetical protein
VENVTVKREKFIHMKGNKYNRKFIQRVNGSDLWHKVVVVSTAGLVKGVSNLMGT